jgi:hypothetical protein
MRIPRARHLCFMLGTHFVLLEYPTVVAKACAEFMLKGHGGGDGGGGEGGLPVPPGITPPVVKGIAPKLAVAADRVAPGVSLGYWWRWFGL